MRVLIDTNLLFSAVYRNGSVPRQAYNKAVEPPHQGLICERSLDELRDSFVNKFPDRADELDLFIEGVKSTVELILVPDKVHPDEAMIRDTDDALILRAAIAADADIIISGDLDFIESGIDSPMIMTAKQFIQTNHE